VLPIKDSNPTRRTAWVTIALIAGNVVVFLLWEPTFATGRAGQLEQEFFFLCRAEIPWEVTHQTNLAEGGAAARVAIGKTGIGDPAGVQRVLLHGARGTLPDGERVDLPACPHKVWWEAVFVSMFLHGGWLHLAGNMLFLWIFGNNVEDKIGRPGYLLFYLLGGIAATALQTAVDPGAAAPYIGASGAIAAVLGAYLVMFPRRRVLVLLFFFIPIWLPAVVVLGVWFVLQLFEGAGGLASHASAGVAYFAHVGGFLFGMLAAQLLFPKERLPRRATSQFEW
jgi:membrane associated rhomboid family serine protease